jgi:hypothetical protein
MKLSLFENAMEKIKTKKVFLVMFLAVVTFLFVSYLVFRNTGLTEQDIPDRENLIEGSDKYKNYINSANRDTKKLLESEQLNQIEQYDNLIEEKDYKKRDNPFAKPF